MNTSINTIDGINSEDLFIAMNSLNLKIKSFNPNLNLLGTRLEHAATFALFDQMSEISKRKIYTDFITYSDLLSSSIEMVYSAKRDKSLTWGALKSLKLSFDESLFENLSNDDIVEIYRNDNLQIFRNLNFHEVCSFHFPELFIKQWPDLFKRDPFITQQIMNSAIGAFTSETCNKIDTSHIPEHNLSEISSPENLNMKMQLKSLYPLRDRDGSVPCILAVSCVKLKDKRKFIDYTNVYSI